MPPKLSDNFVVVYLQQGMPECDNKVFVAPASYVKENYVTYLPFPHTADDKELIHSFLVKKPVPAPPASWTKYSCVILASFATLTGATNKMEKIRQDQNMLKNLLAKALSENLETQKQKKSDKELEAEINAQKELENALKVLPPVQGLNNSTLAQEISESTIEVETSAGKLNAVQEANIIANITSTSDPSFLSFIDDVYSSENTTANDFTHINNVSKVEDVHAVVNKADLEGIKSSINQLSVKVALYDAELKILNGNNKEIINTLKLVEGNLKTLTDIVKSNAKKEKLAAVDIGVKLSELGHFMTERRPLKENENVLSLEKFTQTYQLQLPLQTMDEFKAFDDRLNSDSAFAADLKKNFLSTISSTVEINDTITLIFKAFFKKAILSETVSQKEKAGKLIFKKTKYYAVLKDALVNIFAADFKENLVLHAIMTTISNSKDWEGGRKERETKKILQNISDGTNPIA